MSDRATDVETFSKNAAGATINPATEEKQDTIIANQTNNTQKALVDFQDGPHLDSFSSLRTSQKNILLDAQHHYGEFHHLFVSSLGAPATSISIGASALVTMPTAHGLTAGSAVRFRNIGGALPTGITADTAYFVIATGLTATEFQFSATQGGAAVTTSGSTTGTNIVLSHDLTSTARGTSTAAPATASLTLAVTSTIGSTVVSRSRRFYYVSGQSHLVEETFVFGAGVAGIRKRVGYFDDDDGLFLENNGGTVSLVVRTSTSGSPVDTAIAQTAWDDPMDGSPGSASGITVDWTKAQIFAIDLQWLGVGRVRFYLNIDGVPHQIHEINNANNLDKVYMQTADLPCTYEITNVSAVAGDTFTQICSAVYTEGDLPAAAIRRSESNNTTAVTAADGVQTHILSIRPAQLFKTRKNKGMAIPIEVEVFVTGNTPAHFHVIEDATLTSSTFTAHAATDSMMEYSRGTASVYTAGTGRVRDEGYASASGKGGSSSSAEDQTYRIQIDPVGAPDIFTITAAGIGGTAPTYAKINWKELY